MSSRQKIYLGLFLILSLFLISILWKIESSVPPVPTYTLQKPSTPSKPADLGEAGNTDDSMPKEDQEAAAQIRAAYATGDYGRCLNLARDFEKQVGRSKLFKEWLHKQLGTIYTALAWFELKIGRCDSAIERFKQAELIEKTLETAKGLAYCNYTNHNLENAEDNITWFLKQNGEPDADILFIYSEVLESKGQYAEAAKILETLNEIKKDPHLTKKIEGMKEKAKKANLFQTINTRYFSLTFEDDLHREIAERLLELLEKSLDELIVNYHFREPKKLIEVLLYPEEEFQAFNPDSPLWAEGLFNGRIRIPLHKPYDLNRLQTALRHELVHALFSQMTGSRPLPNWFDEGIAQLASNCNSGCTPFSFGLNPGTFLSEDVFHRSFISYKELLANQVYKQSLYLVLTLDYKNKNALQTIMESIKIDSALDSNSLLKSVDTNFEELRKNAEILWDKRVSF